MQLDKQCRLQILSTIRKRSSIANVRDVAIMMIDRHTIYLVPEENFKEGKMLDTARIDKAGRIMIPKWIREPYKDFLCYLEDEKIIIEMS